MVVKRKCEQQMESEQNKKNLTTAIWQDLLYINNLCL